MAPACPCGLDRPYAGCCGRLHSGLVAAATAEQVMRARYSAFALGDEAYLIASWAPAARPERVRLVPDQRWVGLEVLGTSSGGVFDADGTVEFRASFERGGRAGVLHEHSAFVRDEGRWVYLGPIV